MGRLGQSLLGRAMRIFWATLSFMVLTSPAQAQVAQCDLALLLAIDVSGSVDRDEYQVQLQGIAEGLRDPVVSEALVRARAEVALVQWSGSSRQETSVPWTAVRTFESIDALANTIETAPRRWRNYATALGEALEYSVAEFSRVAQCRRKVIDVSGDGVSNEGIEPQDVRAIVSAADIFVNALAIEGAEEDLTGYLWENVIQGEGAFVVTANGFEEFAERMKLKLRREVRQEISILVVPQDLPNR